MEERKEIIRTKCERKTETESEIIGNKKKERFMIYKRSKAEIDEWGSEYIQITLATTRFHSDPMHKCLLTSRPTNDM